MGSVVCGLKTEKLSLVGVLERAASEILTQEILPLKKRGGFHCSRIVFLECARKMLWSAKTCDSCDACCGGNLKKSGTLMAPEDPGEQVRSDEAERQTFLPNLESPTPLDQDIAFSRIAHDPSSLAD